MDDTEPLEVVGQDSEVAPEAGPDEATAEDAQLDAIESEDEAAPRDPVIGALLIVALGLVVALLATTIGVYVYLTTLNRAPRTTTERDIAAMEIATKKKPDDIQAWTNLAYAYARAGREEDALAAIKRGEKSGKGKSLEIARADVMRFSGKYDESIKIYDAAEKIVEAQFKKQLAAARAKGITADLTDESLGRVYWGRGLAKRETGDLKGAAADLQKASVEMPTSSSLWVDLGDVYAELKQTQKAKAAYQSALKYIPDMEEARAGLARLGQVSE